MTDRSFMSLVMLILGRLLAVAVPAVFAFGLLVWAGSLKSEPDSVERGANPRPVRVLTLQPLPFTPRVSGYGPVEPAMEWRAVARIDGEILETHEGLSNGRVVPRDALLFRIDGTELRLALAQIDARLAALDVRDRTLEASRAIARRDYDLAEADLARKTGLREQGAVSQTVVEQAERAELSAQSRLTDIANQLALNAAERDVLRAERDSAERNLIFTEIRAPFEILIGEVSADQGQVVARAQTLLTAEGVDQVEIAAQVPIGRLGPLARTLGGLDPRETLSATVILAMAGEAVRWPAEISRISEGIDPRTQSVAVIVTVDNPMGQAVPGTRPPLRRGMFVEVVLAAPRIEALVVPATAVWGGEALVVDAENRIARRSVEVGFAVDGLAMIRDGLASGDRLVVSDPALAVVGMTVTPIEDTDLAASIARRAALGSDQ